MADGGEVLDEVPKKRRGEVPQIRGTPDKFLSLIALLSESQRQWVKEWGFGPLLYFSNFKVDRKLAYWVMERFDGAKRRLEIRDDVWVNVYSDDVAWVLGIPGSGLVVPKDYDKDRFKEYCDLLEKKNGVDPNLLLRRVVEDPEMDKDKFKVIFLLHTLGTFLDPSQSSRISPKSLKVAVSIKDPKGYNWCSYVLNKLAHHACEFEEHRAKKARKVEAEGGSFSWSVGFGGCYLFLLFFYFDRLNLGEPINWGSHARITAWTPQLIEHARKMDRGVEVVDGGRYISYGNCEVLDVKTFKYGLHHPLLPEGPLFHENGSLDAAPNLGKEVNCDTLVRKERWLRKDREQEKAKEKEEQRRESEASGTQGGKADAEKKKRKLKPRGIEHLHVSRRSFRGDERLKGKATEKEMEGEDQFQEEDEDRDRSAREFQEEDEERNRSPIKPLGDKERDGSVREPPKDRDPERHEEEHLFESEGNGDGEGDTGGDGGLVHEESIVEGSRGRRRQARELYRVGTLEHSLLAYLARDYSKPHNSSYGAYDVVFRTDNVTLMQKSLFSLVNSRCCMDIEMARGFAWWKSQSWKEEGHKRFILDPNFVIRFNSWDGNGFDFEEQLKVKAQKEMEYFRLVGQYMVGVEELLIPVLYCAHWFAYFFDPKGKKIIRLDSMKKKKSQTYDPIRNTLVSGVVALRKTLNNVVQDSQQEDDFLVVWEEPSTLSNVELEMPIQPTNRDYGVFMLKFLELWPWEEDEKALDEFGTSASGVNIMKYRLALDMVLSPLNQVSAEVVGRVSPEN